jgi:hypothetical protein
MTIKTMCAVTFGLSSLGLASAASAQLVNPESHERKLPPFALSVAPPRGRRGTAAVHL